MYDTTKPYIGKLLRLVEKCRGNIPASTDGIGTKGIYHWKQRTFRNAVIDSLAMNLNDLVVMRAKATGLNNHIMVPREDEEAILDIVKNISEECCRRNIKILSGETAVHDDMSGVEISMSIIGEYIGKKQENKFGIGDYLIGIKSSGLHSNGFTRVRKVFKNEFREDFTKPTIIYYDAVLELLGKFDVHGMVHVTGGAFTKIKPYLNGNDVLFSRKDGFARQDIFYVLYKKDIPDEEMYKTFNCGIGFLLSVNPNDAKQVLLDLQSQNLEARVVGKTVKGNNNVKIESMFSHKKVVF